MNECGIPSDPDPKLHSDIQTENFYKDIETKIKDGYDTSDNPEDHLLSYVGNKKAHTQLGARMRLRSGTRIEDAGGQTVTSSSSLRRQRDANSSLGSPVGNGNKAGQSRGSIGHGETMPHSKCALALIYTFFGVLITMFFIIPIVARSFPWILKEVAFLNRVRWPPTVNLSAPAESGLLHTRHFLIPSNDSNLGAWHILPTLYHVESPLETRYEELLGQGVPVVLYLHGNAGTRAGFHRVQLYKLLSKTGFHVVTFDYRGYGDSPGSPSEEGMGVDAFNTYQWVKKRSENSKLIIWGHSLGSGVATSLAKKLCDSGYPFDRLILESPFNNFLDAAEQHPFSKPFVVLPWYAWGFAETIKFNNISFHSDERIGSVTVPTLIMHAKDDGVVPFELGEKLYKAALDTKVEGGVKFVSFEAERGFGHKHIHKAVELPDLIRDFAGTN